MHEAVEYLERHNRENQDNDEEDDGTVLELPTARGFDAVQYPVGGKIEADSYQREIDYFHCVYAC